jgi:hypothetical protein
MTTQPNSSTFLRAEVAERFRAVTILHHVDARGRLWGTSGRRILRRGRDRVWTRIGSFPFSTRDYFGVTRITARALRADKCNLFVNSHDRAIGIRDSVVYAVEPEAAPTRLTPLFTIQGDSVLHGGICEDLQGWTYVGEYFMNPGRGPVRIWRIAPDLQSWEIAHQFPPASVRHVHGIYRDPYDDQALWVTVGDYAGECFILRTANRFASLEQFGDGSQTWRAVRLFFTPDAVCWLTDTEIEQNYACRMPRGGGLQRGQAIDGPAWYGSMTTDDVYVAFTTVEPGPGVRAGRSKVLASCDAFQWRDACSFRKDLWRPMKLFKYGVIICPSGSMHSREFFISGEGLVGLDGISATLIIC